MTIKDDIYNSGKIDAQLAMQLDDVPDDADPDAPSIDSVFLRLDSPAPLEIEGVKISGSRRPTTIRTAHELSLAGLKKLVESPRVTAVLGATQMRPFAGPRGPAL